MIKTSHRNLVFALLMMTTLTFASCSSFCVENMLELGLKRMSSRGPGWSGSPGGGSAAEDEALVKSAFDAIKGRNYPGYRAVTITTADLIMKRTQVNPILEKQTYAGSVLKPEEISRQRHEYEQAVEGGEGRIDFKSAEWVGLGPVVDSGYQELMESGSVSYTSYAIKIKQGSETVDTTGLGPEFVVVDWGKSRRILRLYFGGHDRPETGPGPSGPDRHYTPPDNDTYTPPIEHDPPPPPYPPPNEPEPYPPPNDPAPEPSPPPNDN